MAQKVQVLLVDDLDGSEATETVTFGLDGSSYEIDLSSGNAEKLRKELARYVEHARKASAPARRRTMRPGPGPGRERSDQIRAWAKQRGYKVNERGRIPATVVQQYEAVVGAGARISAGASRHESSSAQRGYQAENINLRSADEITIDVYLDTDDEAAASAVFAAIDELALAFGIENITPGQHWRGSIFKRSKATVQNASSEGSVEERLLALERLLKSSRINSRDPRQAEEDKAISIALSRLVNSLTDVPRACIRFSSFLLVKYPDDSGMPMLLGRELSLSEIEILEEHPELQKHPETVFDVLALAMSEQIK